MTTFIFRDALAKSLKQRLTTMIPNTSRKTSEEPEDQNLVPLNDGGKDGKETAGNGKATLTALNSGETDGRPSTASRTTIATTNNQISITDEVSPANASDKLSTKFYPVSV